MESKPFHGKVIYNPSGKAGEYSYWAANFYNGCSARCEYCYNRHGRSAKILGADIPTLKKSLLGNINKMLFGEAYAMHVFKKEVISNILKLQEFGLFFNFVSDPFLKETFNLNIEAIQYCFSKNIPVKILTKQTWWVDKFIEDRYWEFNRNLISFGFTLTGHDELEPGAATNNDRIEAIRKLHNACFKTWASIEPIIDLQSSKFIIGILRNYCNLFKIGLQSGVKYNKIDLKNFFDDISSYLLTSKTKVYWKDSLLKQLGINREDLPLNCVNRDFNL